MGELRISTIKTSKRRKIQIPTIVHVRTTIIVPCPGTHLEQTCCSSLCIIYCKGNPFLSDKTCKIHTKGYVCYYQLYSECPAKHSFTFHCSVPLLLLTIYATVNFSPATKLLYIPFFSPITPAYDRPQKLFMLYIPPFFSVSLLPLTKRYLFSNIVKQ